MKKRSSIIHISDSNRLIGQPKINDQWFLFYRTSNLQNMGRAIKAKHPTGSVLNRVEHVVSLFFA